MFVFVTFADTTIHFQNKKRKRFSKKQQHYTLVSGLYYGYMNKVIAKPAPKPRSVTARNIAWIYAGIVTVLVVAQLFAFEVFIPIMDGHGLPGGHGTASLVACLIVFAEVFALPFLLRMRLSPLMRWFSLVCSVLVPLGWLKLAVFALMTDHMVANGGMLGEKVAVSTSNQLVVAIILT